MHKEQSCVILYAIDGAFGTFKIIGPVDQKPLHIGTIDLCVGFFKNRQYIVVFRNCTSTASRSSYKVHVNTYGFFSSIFY